MNEANKGSKTSVTVPARNPSTTRGSLPARKENSAFVVDSQAHVTEAEELFKTLTTGTNCRSLLRKHLTPAIFDKVKGRKTNFGGTLADCIRSGCLNFDSHIGVYACDQDAYTVFFEVLNPLIKEYHKLPPKKNIHQPHLEFSDLGNKFKNLDPEGKFIISTRIGVARSLDGYGFHPVLTQRARQEIESKAIESLNGLTDELKGTYHPLTSMDAKTQARLADDSMLFNDQDRFLKAAGGYDDWPSNRGIFLNESKTFLAWVNAEDHLRIISTQNGGDIGATHRRLVLAMKSLEKELKFARDKHLGFLTFCPSNLGTALRVSVRIRIPNIAASDKFKSTCDKLNLEARAAGILGEQTDCEGSSVFDISNKRCLGISESQVIQEMYNGLKDIIRQEKELSWWPQSVDDMFRRVSKAKNCKSLLKKHLTKNIFEKLKDKETSHGASLDNCIISGSVNLDSEIGLYAADPECYKEFALLFDLVIKDCHKLKASSVISHPVTDFGDLDNLDFTDLDPEGEMIVSTCIRAGRSYKGFAFSPLLQKEERIQIEQRTIDALNSLPAELKGTYYSLDGMSKETRKQLMKDHLLFSDRDRFLKAAGIYKDWPTGRGIFVTENKTFLVWLNGEDHLKIMSTQKNGDARTVYRRLVTAIRSLEEKLTFVRDDRLGYLTCCPSNIGTSLKASVYIKIPHLSSRKDFKSVCDKLRLQAMGIHKEQTDSDCGLWNISNKRQLGLTEIEVVRETVAGIQEIIRLEKEAFSGRTKSRCLL